MIRVFIADDHTIVREGIKQILMQFSDMGVVGEAENGPQLLKSLRKVPCDIVLLDISMPGRNGIEYLKDLKNLKPELPVLVLSMHPEKHYALRALKAGAAGYLTKKSATRELITAIRKVIEGGKYISTSMAEKIAMALDDSSDQPLYKNLSDREFQVLHMIASGKTITEIAQELNLSVQSISTYRSRILSKLDMRTNADIIYYAISNNLV